MKDLKNFTIIIPCIKFNDVKNSIRNIRKVYKNVKILVCLNHKVKYNKDKNLRFIYTNFKGIGAKRNLAVKKASTKYLAFIDSDAYPAKKWLENSIKYLSKKNIGIIAGPHIDPINQNLSEDIVGQVKKSFIITMRPSLQKQKNPIPKIVSFMPSCNWIMKKKNFLKFGYMDGNMLRNEDWDFVFNRMKKKKFKLLYNPKSTIYHQNSTIYHFIKKRFLYGYYMWPILRQINFNNFYFFIPFLFVLYLISLPLNLYFEYYKEIYFFILFLYLSVVTVETIRVSKKLIYVPFIFFIMLLANISPGLGILAGLLNFNKD